MIVGMSRLTEEEKKSLSPPEKRKDNIEQFSLGFLFSQPLVCSSEIKEIQPLSLVPLDLEGEYVQIKQEMKKAGRRHQIDIMTGGIKVFKNILTKYKIVHIACHGITDNRLKNYIELEDSNNVGL